jgi:Holliday junction DNA helicase RuvA
MIAFLRGILAEKQITRAILDVNGVGYEILVPLSSYDRLPSVGSECRLFTHHHVRDDAEQLIGFVTEAELRLFEMLIDVNGIGPRLAIAVLSGLSVREVKAAIVRGDVKQLSGVPGIGRKTAERIVMEMKDRIGAAEALEAVAGPAEGTDDRRARDAVLALVALGYKQDQASKRVLAVLGGSDAGLAVEDIIKKALSG